MCFEYLRHSGHFMHRHIKGDIVYEDNFMGDRGRKFDGFWYLVNALVVS